MKIQIRTKIDAGQLKKAIDRAVAPTVIRTMENVGKDMVQEANDLMEERFDMHRPNQRRRYPGSRRAITALDYFVEVEGDRRAIGFRVLGGKDVLNRIVFLNWGTDPHEIKPSGAWLGAGGSTLAGGRNFDKLSKGRAAAAKPPRSLSLRGSRSGKLAFPYPDEDSRYHVFDRSVFHPGSHWGDGFLEVAQNEAARKLDGVVIN